MSAPRDDRPSQGMPRLEHVDAWVFDLDNTLYPAHYNLFAQVDRRIGRYVADFLGISLDQARWLQKRYFLEHGSTMRGMMTLHGMEAEDFLDYVHDIDVSPVPPSATLDQALGRLTGRKLVFTNASCAHAERVMQRLGVAHHFEAVFDIADADYLPKPHPETYHRLVERYRIDPAATALFEDIARNLLPAAQLGMTTVWVPGDSEWSGIGADGDHIHYVVDDLAPWLLALTAE